jgi:hypothetical protein
MIFILKEVKGKEIKTRELKTKDEPSASKREREKESVGKKQYENWLKRREEGISLVI